MTKIIDKIVVSPTAPKEKNVLWVDDDSINIPSKGKWKKASGGGSGSSGIDIVESVDKLDKNAPVGSMASVVTIGSIKETSVRNLYQPDMSMLDQMTGTITQPELLSSVNSIEIFVPTNLSNIEDTLINSGFYLIPRDFSSTNQTMAMIQFDTTARSLMAMSMIEGYNNMQQFVFVEFSSDTNSFIIHDDQVEAFNAILANDIDWCYFGNPELSTGLTEEMFDVLDLFVNTISGIPSIADVYIKRDRWEKLQESDLKKLANDLDKTNTIIESKADKIAIATYNSYNGLQPNVYTTHSISSTGTVTIKLAAISDTTIYNEYILELKCTNTPSSVAFNNVDGTIATIVWTNGITPTFEKGMTYIISIANGFGVYSMFPNS